jgi:Zn-dependent protease with chaperone function
MALAARYFDGVTSRIRDVQLDLRDGRVLVAGDEVSRDEPLAAVEIPPALGRTPRQVRFPDGAFCEVADSDAFARLIAAEGTAAGLVAHWEQSRRWVFVSAIAFVVMIWGGYRFGLPAAATVIAFQLPEPAVRSLGTHVLAVLDRTVFDESAVAIERQAQLMVRFEALRLPGETDDWQHQILFRRSNALGANALALPSGEIVLTDGIVNLAEDERELLAVLAHEAGHVQRRHSVRHLLQNSVVALLLTWYVGDVGTLAAAAPTVLLQAKYSRDFEREADDYAARALRENGLDISHLADMLTRLERAQGASASYLASHPSTAERIAAVRDR